TTQGTPEYMAPEQALDFHAADTRADIYSLGCTLFFLLAGRPPFPGGSLAEKLMKHQQAEPPIAGLRADLPAGLEAVLRQMLAKQPADRFQTPAAVVDALIPFGPAPDSVPTTIEMQGQTTSCCGPGVATPGLWLRFGRRPLLLASALVLALIGFLLLFLLSG